MAVIWKSRLYKTVVLPSGKVLELWRGQSQIQPSVYTNLEHYRRIQEEVDCDYDEHAWSKLPRGFWLTEYVKALRQQNEAQRQRIAELEQPGFWKTEADRYFNEIVHLKDTAHTNEKRIAALEAQLNTRNEAVERDGDPLRRKLSDLVAMYGSATFDFAMAQSGSKREERFLKQKRQCQEELDARLSTLVDTIRVLMRDNQNCFADNARHKAALEEVYKIAWRDDHEIECAGTMERIGDIIDRALDDTLERVMNVLDQQALNGGVE